MRAPSRHRLEAMETRAYTLCRTATLRRRPSERTRYIAHASSKRTWPRWRGYWPGKAEGHAAENAARHQGAGASSGPAKIVWKTMCVRCTPIPLCKGAAPAGNEDGPKASLYGTCPSLAGWQELRGGRRFGFPDFPCHAVIMRCGRAATPTAKPPRFPCPRHPERYPVRNEDESRQRSAPRRLFSDNVQQPWPSTQLEGERDLQFGSRRRPYRETDESSTRCSKQHTSSKSGASALRPGQSHGQRTRDESFRSIFLAKASLGQWACRGCPWPVIGG
jgi:hypothetical protein